MVLDGKLLAPQARAAHAQPVITSSACRRPLLIMGVATAGKRGGKGGGKGGGLPPVIICKYFAW